MQEAIRLRELEAECRQRALSEPDKKWYWLAQAAKYQVQASQKLAFRSEEANTPDFPEVKLAQWSHGRDERRVMEPLPEGRRSALVAARLTALTSLLLRRLDMAEREQQREIVGDLQRAADHQR